MFVPNDYLYTEYAKTVPGHEKMEKWEIYAHAVHDFMCKEGGFGVNEQPTRFVHMLTDFLWGKTDQI